MEGRRVKSEETFRAKLYAICDRLLCLEDDIYDLLKENEGMYWLTVDDAYKLEFAARKIRNLVEITSDIYHFEFFPESV